MSRFGRLLGRSGPQPAPVALPTGLLECLRDGPAALEPGGAQAAQRERLRIAVVVPPFRRGSGGHGTIANLVRGLEARGHDCALWVLDDEQRHVADEARVAADFRAWFGPLAGPIRLTSDGLHGSDVALATGWQTVPAVLGLRGVHARGYLVQDHEPEFYATSAEREWAIWTYRQGLFHVAASRWLASLLREQYGAAASSFDLGVDHARYALPQAGAGGRREDRVLFYARAVTARRAVPLGLLALRELARRRPQLEIALFGDPRVAELVPGARQLGVLSGEQLARQYGEATVGMVLSMTNPSLVPLEMLACGLPVVDLASDSMRAEFGDDGPLLLARFDPLALCDALERLLDDPAERADRAARGVDLVAARTWAAASGELEQGLREALREASSGGRT